MAVYRIRVLDTATRDLAQLDKPVGRRIVERIRWLAENLDVIRPEALTGDFTGFYKLRVGDYRVLYEIFVDERTIMIQPIAWLISNCLSVGKRESLASLTIS